MTGYLRRLRAHLNASGRRGELAALMRTAWEEGAHGLSLECVDYNNYRPRTREALRTLRAGSCRFVMNQE